MEFYLIENPFLAIADPEERYPKDKSLDISLVKGTFMGTDYSFSFSKKMQDTIIGNCIDYNRDGYMRF